ncbi:MAG: DUF4838 domain-containing protein [bacterium]
MLHCAVVAAAAACAGITADARERPLTLIENGRSGYSIVIPDDADETVIHAADELRNFLEEIGGARLVIVPESGAPDSPHIFVGPVRKALELTGAEEYGSLGAEGFIIRTSGENLFIAGGAPRGTLYGAYTFLEENLGCRWYAPDASLIPKKDRVIVTGLDVRQAPAFEYREPFFHHAFDADWAARNKVNGTRPPLTRKHGGKIEYSHFVHTFYDLVPPDEYFDEHPEYFALINGKRTRENAQLCLTNPDLVGIAAGRVLAWMRENPAAAIFSVSQNDNVFSCQCRRCLESDRLEGSPAGTLLRFVNAVAAETAKKHPDKFIDTLAYQYTERPPLLTKPRPNVIVRLCHMAPSCDLHQLNRCMWNANYVKNLKAWTKITERVYVWHYVTDFHHYVMPFPDLKAIVRDIPFYSRQGVRGFFGQGSYESPGGDMAELKAWLIAKLLWNPDADPDALIRDFVGGYFGAAAPHMLDYLAALHEKTRRRNVHANLYSPPTAGFLDRELLEYADVCFDRAEKAAADDRTTLDRVRKARLPLDYVKLAAPQLYGWTDADLRRGGGQDQFARFEKFKSDLAYFNITRIKEWEPLEETLDGILARMDNE